MTITQVGENQRSQNCQYYSKMEDNVDVLSLSLTYLFGILKHSPSNTEDVENGRKKSSGLEAAMRSQLYLSKKQRLKRQTLGSVFEKTQRSVMYHLLR